MQLKSLAAAVSLCCVVRLAAQAAEKPTAPSPAPEPSAASGAFVLPDAQNPIQFRLYTNAAPDAAHLFNTFEIDAYGERLLSSPTAEDVQRLLAASPTNPSLHCILVNGAGPNLSPGNSLRAVEQASGPDWRGMSFDAAAAYRGRLQQFRRSLLFVAPDLFVVHDHLLARSPATFAMILHTPAATRVDPVWHDLRLDLPKASLRVIAPSRHQLRRWEPVQAAADSALPGTMTVRLGPTNLLAQLDLLTVFAVGPAGDKQDYAFKLIESNEAVGVRVLRGGWPTVAAFRTGASGAKASVAGFEFAGPMGVGVFHPRQKSPPAGK